jgi:hypothetical protein
MTSDFRWSTLIVSCAERLRDSEECSVPFVDCEVVPPFDGSPDGIFIWFICETVALKERFRAEALLSATRRLRAIAIEGGFPAAAADTLLSDVTSKEDIEQGGGRFYFFR